MLGDEEPSSSWRSSVLLEKLPQGDTSEEEKGKGKEGKTGAAGVPKTGGEHAFRVISAEAHEYVEYYAGQVKFYDLEADPYKLESIHESADPGLLEDLKAKLEALKSCSEEGCREDEDAS